MSTCSEPLSGTPGRFLRRLEALENLVREFKQKNTLLQMRVEAMEKWKEHAEQWLFENFEVKFDLSMQFQVDKVEVKPDPSDSLDTDDGVGVPPDVDNEYSTQRSSVKDSIPKLSQNSNFLTSTPKSSIAPVPSNSPKTNILNGTANKNRKTPSVSSKQSDDVEIIEQGTSEVDHGISIRSVRSLFDSDIEIEESINLGASSAACTPTNSGAAGRETRNRTGPEKIDAECLSSNSTSVAPKLPVVELVDEEEQLGEPSVTAIGILTPNVSVTTTPMRKTDCAPSSPRKNMDMNGNTPKKDKTETQTAFIAPSRINVILNRNTKGDDNASNFAKPSALANRSAVPPRPRSLVDASSKSPSVAVASSPYKGSAMVKPHRRKSTQSAYGSSSPRIGSTSGVDCDSDDTPCDVCLGVEPELGNEMVFCDSCNVCVHQACYGVRPIPLGKWLCNPCKQGLNPKEIQCRFCPNFGGALKPVLSPAKTHWGHVSCALWIPEVKLGSKTNMEPIINIQRVPKDRWSLRCQLCNEKRGACIQCQFSRKCVRAFHVTCAMRNHLEMKGTVDDDLNDGCELRAFCKFHSFGGGIDKKRKKPKKRAVSKSPNKKPRLDPEAATVVPENIETK